MRYMGIDGGGSSLRVVIVDDDLRIVVEKHHHGVNPGEIGHRLAASRIQETVSAALAEDHTITACAIGIAGAADHHSAEWLTGTLFQVLPRSIIVPSSDLEIALVGAHGQRQGILLLAGTGSAAFGIDQHGTQALVGAWGYLVDDLGSGYWIGNQVLQHTLQTLDGRSRSDTLSEDVLHQIACRDRNDIVHWLYHREEPIVPRIAKLSDLVLNAAEAKVKSAVTILDDAASHLNRLALALGQHLDDAPTLPVRFAGGLLQQPNALSERVREKLGLQDFPVPLYPPVVGAALLAKLHAQRQ